MGTISCGLAISSESLRDASAPLEREAAKARQYLDLFEEKKQTDVSLWLYDMAALRTELEERAAQLALSKEEYSRTDELLTDLEGRSEHLYRLTLNGKKRIEEIAAQAAALTEQTLKRETEIKVLENEIGHIDGTLSAQAEVEPDIRHVFVRCGQSGKRPQRIWKCPKNMDGAPGENGGSVIVGPGI